MKPFATIVADPPWPFRDTLPGPGRGAAKHYDVMSQLDIVHYLPGLLSRERAPVRVAADAWLFLWRVASQPEEAIEVVRLWGFRPKAEIVWVKIAGADPTRVRIGMGRTVRNCHETCIVATRGKPERLSASVPSVLLAPRGEHSAKPEAFRELVERLAPGPYLELFARTRRKGWTCMGAELDGAA